MTDQSDFVLFPGPPKRVRVYDGSQLRAYIHMIAQTSHILRQHGARLHTKDSGHAIYADWPHCLMCVQLAISTRNYGTVTMHLNGEVTLDNLEWLLAQSVGDMVALAFAIGTLYVAPLKPTKDMFGMTLASVWEKLAHVHAVLSANNVPYLLPGTFVMCETDVKAGDHEPIADWLSFHAAIRLNGNVHIIAAADEGLNDGGQLCILDGNTLRRVRVGGPSRD